MEINRRRVTLLQLVAATCFMVSGGPYGLEDVVHDAGYGLSIVILLLTPILWSIPTALMVGELASSIPNDGGYYVWVRRAMGPAWGFQEAWLSIVSSIFDMAIYPTLFVAYAGQLFPQLSTGHWGLALGLTVIGACAVWNLLGAREVGRASLLCGLLLLAPFVVICALAIIQPHSAFVAKELTNPGHAVMVGILVSMWNYMGWDNASTIAAEVERPQRTYPVAMLLSVVAITLLYVVCVAACWYARLDLEVFKTGGWASVGRILGGSGLQISVVVGGCVSTFATFNSLVMSYSRVPYAMAKDNLLPRIFMRTLKSGAPWVSIITCSSAWAFSLGLPFSRLVELDIVLYGASLLLEFIALTVLRIKEPQLQRPYKVPGGIAATIMLAVPPAMLLVMSLMQGVRDQVAGMNVLVFSGLFAVAGWPIYFLMKKVSASTSHR